MFERYNHLGFYNPFYFRDNLGEFVIRKSFPEISSLYTGKLELDVVGIIELFSKRHFLGDRTLVKGVRKTPWMAKPAPDNKSWEYFSIPPHDERESDEQTMAKKLFHLICQEILEYVGESRSVGILLSGGMDSRMVAGALDYLIKTGQLSNLSVRALTWGNDNSRDVVYARRIADRLGWDWKQYKVGPEELYNNIEQSADRGCEYAAMHLHAIPQIRDDNELDCVLGGSYGDSVGRAEYSGVGVRNLDAIGDGIINFGGLLKINLFEEYQNVDQDIKEYHDLFPQPKKYQQYELDHQLHYMRRMLNPCMEVIGEKMPFYQVFTKPEVFSYMWSINPKYRNDEVYRYMLKHFYTSLNDIPWARTGIEYGKTEGIPDKFSKEHHSYSFILSNELYSDIARLVMSEQVKEAGIFNIDSIKNILSLIKYLPKNNFDYLERITWLASFARFMEKYNISGAFGNTGVTDLLQANIHTPSLYIGKYVFRELRKKI